MRPTLHCLVLLILTSTSFLVFGLWVYRHRDDLVGVSRSELSGPRMSWFQRGYKLMLWVTASARSLLSSRPLPLSAATNAVHQPPD